MRIAQRNTGPPWRRRTTWASLVAALCLLVGPGLVPTPAKATPSPGSQKIALVVRPSHGMADPMQAFSDAGHAPRERRTPASPNSFALAVAGSPAFRAGGSTVVHLC